MKIRNAFLGLLASFILVTNIFAFSLNTNMPQIYLSGSGGYDDWFLPSSDEMDLLYRIRGVLGVDGFSPGVYWSSTEYRDDDAWVQTFINGNQYDYGKGYTRDVRAVRAF